MWPDVNPIFFRLLSMPTNRKQQLNLRRKYILYHTQICHTQIKAAGFHIVTGDIYKER